MSGYNSFAQSYDRLTENVGYPLRAEYIVSLLAESGVRDGILLDLACGTARLSVCLAKHGFEVIGVDSSSDMLAEAMSDPDFGCSGVMLICQEMQSLDLFGTIRAAVCSLDSINHLTDEADVKKTFERVALFMEKDGVFVFDINTPFKHREILADNVFVYDLDDVYCVWQNSLQPDGMTVDISLDIFNRSGKAYIRTEECFSERAYEIADITRWLNEAGFEVCEIYDEMTKEPPKENSQRLYFVAKRK